MFRKQKKKRPKQKWRDEMVKSCGMRWMRLASKRDECRLLGEASLCSAMGGLWLKMIMMTMTTKAMTMMM